jgi:uncharacterized protein DUF6304
LDEERVFLSLRVDEEEFHSTGKSGWFENELLDLQQALPNGTYIKSCINCGLSDYWPGGNPSFGGLLCFRDSKADYRQVKSKSDLHVRLLVYVHSVDFGECFYRPSVRIRRNHVRQVNPRVIPPRHGQGVIQCPVGKTDSPRVVPASRRPGEISLFYLSLLKILGRQRP